MEEEWRIYLREHAPEMYEQMKGSVAWAAEWRDKKISELTKEVERLREAVLFELGRRADQKDESIAKMRRALNG